MVNGWQQRLRMPGRRVGLPLVLLLLALSGLFLFSHDREYFYRGGWHDRLSSKTLAYAENLSFRHNLLVFHYQSRDADGRASYPFPYNRFPLGGFILVKLAILPFGDDAQRAKIYAGRTLLLLLYSAAAVLAYAALTRIIGSRWDALTATLLAFSSYYILFYADMVSNEVIIDLFGVMLAFHGMVIFVQEGRFRQLLIKSCVALLLGWHVYAFLLPFIALGVAVELVRARQSTAAWHRLCNLKRYAAALRRSRYLLLGVITLLFGIGILAFNFGSEYFALNGAVAFRELPSVNSAVARLGGDADSNVRRAERLQPAVFWPNQFYRIAVMTLPYAVNPYEIKGRLPEPRPGDYPAIAGGALALSVCLVGLVGIRRRSGMARLLATLTVSGFCWAWMVRHLVASHDFESVFYLGIPLAAFTLALLGARRLSRSRLSPYFAVAALAMFVCSVSAMAGVGQSRAELSVEAEQLAEYAVIRKAADDSQAIYVPWSYLLFRHGGTPWASSYFLAGKTLVYTDTDGHGSRKPKQAGDYLLLLTREDSPALLTPDNRHVFLYDWALYDQWRRTADLGRPIIAGGWQVYLRDGHLAYVSAECVNRDEPFFLHLEPRYAIDLPADRKEYGFDNYDFGFGEGGLILTDGTCVVERRLPAYDIAAIHTGQYNADGRIWEREYRLPAPSSAASGR